MKKVKLSMIAIISILSLFSCKKDTPTITPTPTPIGLKDTTVTFQPGLNDGQDALILSKTLCSDAGNTNFNIDILQTSAWTFSSQGCGTGSMRSLIKFKDIDNIPNSATIISAKLSLFGISSSGFTPEGNSYYPGSPYTASGTNESWIQRITNNWNESTVTWNNQPNSVDTNQVTLPASNLQWNYNATDIDVTSLVKDIKRAGSINHGFMLKLKNEQYYRSLLFASSEHTNASSRPKLVINYKY
jgi:hypothetical protein